MTSPFERLAEELNREAKLPTDNWFMRRVENTRSHAPSVAAIMQSVGKMGALVLRGRIATNIGIEGSYDIRTTNPSTDIAKISIGVLPTSAPRRWLGRGMWTPDSAMAVGIHLEDSYDYSVRGKPRPTGQVGLTMFARTWGKLAEHEEPEILGIDGASVNYGDNGFDRRGARVCIRRTPGHIIDPVEVETVLAPLSRHVIDYFNIMDLKDPGLGQPPGNFSNRSDYVRSYVNPQQIQPQEIVIAGLNILNGTVESTD